MFPLTNTNGLCLLTHNENKIIMNYAIQQIALRLLLSFPIGMSKFTFIDPTGSGDSFKYLTGFSTKIVGDSILTDLKEN